MSNPFATPGMFSWAELMTTDTASAREFYGHVFGWRYKRNPLGTGEYMEVLAGSQSVGGMRASPPGCPAPPCWNNYVTVADIDAIFAQASALGGSVAFGPKEIPGIRRFAVVRDPRGADLLPIQYGMATLPSAPQDPHGTPGCFSWVELMASDVPAARNFYSKLFGWTFEKAGGFDYQIIKLGDQMVGGLMAMPPSCPGGTPAHWSTYVTVSSVDDACGKAKSLGGIVLAGPEDVPTVGRFAAIQDRQGAAIVAMQWAKC